MNELKLPWVQGVGVGVAVAGAVARARAEQSAHVARRAHLDAVSDWPRLEARNGRRRGPFQDSAVVGSKDAVVRGTAQRSAARLRTQRGAAMSANGGDHPNWVPVADLCEDPQVAH